ncbi:chitin synthase export chaperone [Pseudohyphozyma bogoriensis]|nr:chitin synthase export chaperone [Pseudohyphozyma bogoriensis]
MVWFDFGDYDWLTLTRGLDRSFFQMCDNVPSLPACNLFFRQMLVHPKGLSAPATDILKFPANTSSTFAETLSSYGVGVGSSCYIPRMAAVGGQSGSLGNVANIALCGLSVLIALALAVMAGRRAAAVARVEMRIFFLMYALVQGAQLVDTGAFLRAGGTALTWVSAIHLGLVVGLFWCLLWIAFLSLQVVEDGTIPSILPMLAMAVVLVVGSSYIFLDIGFTITNYFQSSPAASLHSDWLFILTIIWPAAAAFLYFAVQLGVVVRVLKESKPLVLFSITAFLFILSQAAYFGISHKICTGTSHKVDGSFIATLLETAAVGALFAAWRSITEDSWDDYTVSSALNY